MEEGYQEVVSYFEKNMNIICKELPCQTAERDKGWWLNPSGAVNATCEYTEANEPKFLRRTYAVILRNQQRKASKASNPTYQHLHMLLQPKTKEKNFLSFKKRLRISPRHDDIED